MPSDDISRILHDWPFDSGRINVRLIEGEDGRPRLQIRVLLGVLQLEVTGRPDGLKPEGHESLLDHQLERLKRYEEATGAREGFVLSPDECRALREEAVLYYHRYVGLFVMEDFDGVIRDTTRNLRVLDLCRDHASAEDDRVSLEQFRPYIVMMRSRAQAAKSIGAADAKRAIAHIDAGIAEIRAALEDIGMGDRVEDSNEIRLLQGMREALIPKLPTSQRVELESRLKAALAAENYELAAILRDELRLLRE